MTGLEEVTPHSGIDGRMTSRGSKVYLPADSIVAADAEVDAEARETVAAD